MMQTRAFDKKQAKKLWELFFEKYKNLEENACTTLPPNFQETPFLSDLSQSLEEAIDRVDLNNDIFSTPALPYHLRFLYESNKISFQQFCTLMERQQTFTDFPHINTFRILENGEFTPEAKKFFLPTLNKSSCLKPLDENQLEELKTLISALPRSERIFYTTKAGKLENEEEDSLGNTLLSTGTNVLIKEENRLIHVSVGVFDAIGLIRFGLEEYIRPIHQFGKQNINAIEEGIRQYARKTALNHPDAVAYDNIHDFENVTPLEATIHDKFHAIVMSAMPKSLLHVIWHLIDVARNVIGHQWSKEIWTLIDCELLYCLSSHKNLKTPLSNEKMTQVLCESLKMGNNTFMQMGQYSSLIMRREITPSFIAIILDLYQNPDKWLALQIEPQYLIGKFKEYYAVIGEIYSLIKNDDPKIQLLKCQIYFCLLEDAKCRDPLTNIKKLAKIIDENQDGILKNLTLMKVKKKDDDFPRFMANSIYLSYANSKTPEGNYKKIIQLSYLTPAVTQTTGYTHSAKEFDKIPTFFNRPCITKVTSISNAIKNDRPSL